MRVTVMIFICNMALFLGLNMNAQGVITRPSKQVLPQNNSLLSTNKTSNNDINQIINAFFQRNV